MDLKNIGRASRDLPQPRPDGNDVDLRLSRYGDQQVMLINTTKHGISEEGSYFTASSGPGTFVAQQAQITAFADTGPLFVLFNKDQQGGRRIYLDYLRLALGGTAPTGTVSLELAVRGDTVSKLPTNANQYTSPVPVNSNTAIADRQAVAQLYAYLAAQAMVAPASSGQVRNLGKGRIPTGLGIVGDEYTFQFGATERAGYMGLTAARAVVPAKLVGDMPPIMIGPQSWATFHLWWLTSATNVPTWEWEMGWWER